MCIDISQKIPPDSIISDFTLKFHHAKSGSPWHFILEELSELTFSELSEIIRDAPKTEKERAEFWERYRERLSIMIEGKSRPTIEQKKIAFRSALNSLEPWPQGVIPNTAMAEEEEECPSV